MVEVRITQTRYGNGQRKYMAGSIVELSKEKAAMAVDNGWAEYLAPQPREPKPEPPQTAVSKKAETRQTAEGSNPTKRQYKRKKSK